MESKLYLLYKLQQTDSQIDQIHLLRGELPLEVQDLEDDILGLTTRTEKLQAEIKEIEKTISQKKIDLDTSKDLVEKYSAQQGNVKNNREYDSLSKEIEFQGLEAQLSEKRIKESAVVLAERKLVYADTVKALDERKLDLENKMKELENIVAQTAKEEKELNKYSDELQSQIDVRLLAAYEKVRANARNGLAVVTVSRDACSGCFNKIPPQRQLDIASSKKIIVCEYCGRILVNADFEAEAEAE
ncbi:MAG: C4-type zinc ribbon domain-containing protein [Bacteroidales bacterium]